MFIINSSPPKTTIIFFKWCSFSKVSERAGWNVSNKFQYFKSKILIMEFKLFQIINGIWKKPDFSHVGRCLFINASNSSIENVTPFPASISEIDLFRRFQYCSLVSFLKPLSVLSWTAMVISAFFPLSKAGIFSKSSWLNSVEEKFIIASIK